MKKRKPSFLVRELKNPIVKVMLIVATVVFAWYMTPYFLPIVVEKRVQINEIGQGGGSSTESCQSFQSLNCSAAPPKKKIVTINENGKKRLRFVSEEVCKCVTKVDTKWDTESRSEPKDKEAQTKSPPKSPPKSGKTNFAVPY